VNRFPRVIGVRLGYDPEQVDELILRIERTLGRGRLDGQPVTADEIRGAKFGVKLGGYNETAVDFALDAFIVALETRDLSAADLPTGEEPSDLDAVRQAGEGHGESARSEEPSAEIKTKLSPTPEVGASRVGGVGQGAESESEAGPATRGKAVSGTRGKAVSGTRGEAVSGTRGDAGSDVRGGAGAVESREAGLGETVAGGEIGGAQAEGGESGRTQADAGRDVLIGAEPEDRWEAEATRVEQMAFRPGRLGMGYREQDVDALLDRVVATLRGTTDQPVTAEQIRAATFATVVFRSGYAIGEVDRFLAELAGVLERRG
jgi:DivIVA domain-containing protein